MRYLPKSLDALIDDIAKLPGIGKKSAERLAIFLLDSEKTYLDSLSLNINNLNTRISQCEICHCFMDSFEQTNAEKSECIICDEDTRNQSILCLIKKPSDVIIFERTGYNGLYHVLGNLLSPIDGVNEDSLNINSLMTRLKDKSEIILAMDASIEGDATALYLSNLLSSSEIKISRLARGLPIGGTLDHIDQTTLSRSIEDRVEIK
jgi:recombination protein RecR